MKTPSAAGLNAAKGMVSKALRSPWPYVILAIIILWLLYRNGGRWWAKLTAQDKGNYAGQPAVASNPAREAQLQAMAHDLFVAISGLPGLDRMTPIIAATGLNDTELRYVATFYADSANPDGTALSEDLGDEWGLGDPGSQLITRLTQLAL